MAKHGRDHHYFKHGLRAGYSEWRYGTSSARLITLAGRTSKRPFNSDKRRHIVDKVIDWLRDWRQSPFEHEGPIRAGIRSSLCLQGYSWHTADREAESLLADAFRLMGVERPSWAQGQREYAESREVCLWCKLPLSQGLIEARRRFCSDQCAIACKEHNAGVYKAAQQHTRSWAHYLVSVEKSEERLCQECNVGFRSRDPDARFCTHKCFLNHQSKKTTVKTCLWCSRPFMAGNSSARYCSRSCTEAEGQIRRGKWKPKRLTAPVFDHYFTTPINKTIARQVTPQRLDWFFLQQGLRITGEVRVAA